jgi:hypothetical protein
LRSGVKILVLIAVGLSGCASLTAEVIARTVNDPGPTATVAMVPLGPPSVAELVQHSKTNSSRCAENARVSAGHRIGSQATRAKLATERYVLCMAAQGYRCANRSEHKACEAAWTHATATREQWAQDSGDCVRAGFWVFLASTRHSRYIDCMASKGYRADVGEMDQTRP